jgi:hypothetical protein
MKRLLWRAMPFLIGTALGPAAGLMSAQEWTAACGFLSWGVVVLFVFAYLMATFDDWYVS